MIGNHLLYSKLPVFYYRFLWLDKHIPVPHEDA
ncbi:hypothetical protein CPS_1149 [Colwellia psychrerythraea 34H]|uniref:Uncharacterized protein n=1 Tax=Colwellia psychrerythraea (strain 34H / ATCC BAA-681) TaxID=167879 RepID=Q486X3_COLP3|nr:hypothetical protein CPS_1149 [Colwellia psychrerythraea 34H]